MMTTTRTSLALATLFALSACGGGSEQPASEPVTAPQDSEFAGDIAVATREAAADTEAAVREAGAALDTGAAPAAAPEAVAPESVSPELEAPEAVAPEAQP